MNRFAALLDALLFTPSRNGKLRLMQEYFAREPDPERGWALAALTGEMAFRRGEARPDPRARRERGSTPSCSRWSYDFVGDLAETVSLIWPARSPAPDAGARALPRSSTTLSGGDARRGRRGCSSAGSTRSTRPGAGRCLKLVTGGLRIGVSARLAKTALAEWAGVAHRRDRGGLARARAALSAACSPGSKARRRGPRPAGCPNFTPLMLAQPLEDDELAGLDPADYRAEWKWDGIRVQLVARGGERRLYSRSGDDIGAAFPDIVRGDAGRRRARRRAAGDARRRGRAVQRSAAAPQPQDADAASCCAISRLGPALRHAATRAARILRGLPFDERRQRLEAWYAARAAPAARSLAAGAVRELGRASRTARRRARARHRRADAEAGDSLYLSGRPKGPWFKWKRDALTLDAVLMYAQRGHGKRSSFYSDYTFGVWRDDELVPVGKAYFGFTDDELRRLDRWVRDNTVRALRPGARGRARPGARNRLRQRAPLDPPQIRRRDALSAHPPHPLGQARPRSRHAGDLGRAADLN